MPGDSAKRYPLELKQRAVRVVAEIRADHDSDWAAMKKVAQLLGVSSGETFRKWMRQAEVDGGARPGVTTEDSAEIKRLKRENAELRRANSSSCALVAQAARATAAPSSSPGSLAASHRQHVTALGASPMPNGGPRGPRDAPDRGRFGSTL